ncbi:hypothetical protein T261_4321 [Streptomyces lydicus]|nr:hypothetical protein T261_4321 [Streptomyces lydicus]
MTVASKASVAMTAVHLVLFGVAVSIAFRLAFLRLHRKAS